MDVQDRKWIVDELIRTQESIVDTRERMATWSTHIVRLWGMILVLALFNLAFLVSILFVFGDTAK